MHVLLNANGEMAPNGRKIEDKIKSKLHSTQLPFILIGPRKKIVSFLWQSEKK